MQTMNPPTANSVIVFDEPQILFAGGHAAIDHHDGLALFGVKRAAVLLGALELLAQAFSVGTLAWLRFEQAAKGALGLLFFGQDFEGGHLTALDAEQITRGKEPIHHALGHVGTHEADGPLLSQCIELPLRDQGVLPTEVGQNLLAELPSLGTGFLALDPLARPFLGLENEEGRFLSAVAVGLGFGSPDLVQLFGGGAALGSSTAGHEPLPARSDRLPAGGLAVLAG